jgi:hypothetical protein
MLLFQIHRGNQTKSEKEKAGFDIYQVSCGENKLDSMPRTFERAKAEF